MGTDYILTGSAGFICSHLIQRLTLDRATGGGSRLLCIDNLNTYYDPRIKRLNRSLTEGLEGVRSFEMDIVDEDSVKGLMEEARGLQVRAILHLAAQPGVRYSMERPREVHDINVNGTRNMLELARSLDVEVFVNASSSSVYGVSDDLPFREGAGFGLDRRPGREGGASPTEPMAPYGASKLEAEHLVREYSETHGFRAVNLRYFTVFGPRVRPDLAINIFSKAALANRPIEIFGTGDKTRDFTYIDNIVDGTVKAMEKGNGVYNLGCGKRTSIKELAHRIIELTGSRSEIVHHEDAPGDMEHTLADISKARRELGYEVRVDLDEGLRRYIDWVRGPEGQRFALEDARYKYGTKA